MKLMSLVALLGMMGWVLYVWLGQYSATIEGNTDTMEGRKSGIVMPIDMAEDARSAIESRYE